MNKQIIFLSSLLAIGTGLTFECHSASGMKNVLSTSALAVRLAFDYPQRTLGIRMQPEFKNPGEQLITGDGNFAGKARWLDNNNQVMLGHEVSYQEATARWLGRSIIKTAKKAVLPLLAATCIGGIGGVYGSLKLPGGDGVTLLALLGTVYGVRLGVGAAAMCALVGFNPISKAFLANMEQQVLLKNGNKYYYGYPEISKALWAQGVYSIVASTEAETRRVICVEKVS